MRLLPGTLPDCGVRVKDDGQDVQSQAGMRSVYEVWLGPGVMPPMLKRRRPMQPVKMVNFCSGASPSPAEAAHGSCPLP